ncbi:MAG: hypothetical protein WCS94_01240 [Verrucomicrobiota bacterium]
MKQHAKLSTQQEQATEQKLQTAPKEFATSDELLRFDAAQTEVPAKIAERLQKSAARIHPPATGSWWKKLLGR